jgi:hypothetical protein
VLLAAPQSLAGSRLYKTTSYEDEAAIGAYGKRVLALLEKTPQCLPGGPNELDPVTLAMSVDAEKEWIAFFDHVETACGPHGDLVQIRDVAAKVAENAARMAGVIGAIERPDIQEIGLASMRCGIGLADWYLGEALRLAQASRLDPKLMRAQSLLDWLRSREEREFAVRDILRLGPSSVRTKAAAEDAVAILNAHNWLRELAPRPKRYLLLSEGG